MNKHGVSRRWITETDVKYFKGAAITIIARKKEYTFYGKLKKKKKKRIPPKVCFKDFFVHRYRTAF